MSRSAPFAWILFVTMASINPPPLTAQPPAPPEKPLLKQPSLMELTKLYQDLDLPVPPKDAFFAMVDEGTSLGYAPASKLDITYQLHLATGGPYPNAHYRVWSGLKTDFEETLAVIFTKPPSPAQVLSFLRLRRLRGEFDPGNENYGELVFAIHCQLLGHFELARFFYGRCQKSETRPLNENLVLVAWNYWGTELGNPKRDLALVSKKLRHLVDKHHFFELLGRGTPAEKEQIERDIEEHQTLLDRLEWTLKTKQVQPGSLEALIEGLLVDPTAGDGWEMLPSGGENPNEKDQTSEPGNQQLVATKKLPDSKSELTRLGFAAIPSLIEHVDDQRLVRHRPMFLGGLVGLGQENSHRLTTINARSYRTIGSVVRDLLSTFFILDEQKAEKADYVSAWRDMKSMTEAEFVSKALADPDKRSWNFIQFARAKYKEKCIDSYKLALRKNLEIKWFGFLTRAIVESNLTPSEKIELLSEGASKGSLQQKYDALYVLADLDNAVFSKLCVLTLKGLPQPLSSDDEEKYHFLIINLAFRTKDRGARDFLENYTMNLPISKRLKILDHLSGLILHDIENSPFRPFILRFFDDKNLYAPDKDDRDATSILGSDLTQIEVRNFVANKILIHMKIDLPIDDKTTDETWAKIRELAKDEVDRRLEIKSKR